MPAPLRVAVIGAGAFGRNHLRVLHDLSSAAIPQPAPATSASSRPEAKPQRRDPCISPAEPARRAEPPHLATPRIQLAAVVDANPATRAEASARYAIPGFASVDDLLAANLGLHAATVCVPTLAHAEIAEHLLQANLDVLVEKPLTATLAEADRLIALASRLGRILAAGHLERFNPAVTAAQSRLTRPMFFEAHRLSIFTPRSLDVDVVLDLMIHDLDILLTFAQAPVTEVRAVGLPVLSRKTDIANVRLEFASGAVANLTASRVSTEQVRKLRLFQPAQYLSLDYARQELLTINVDPALAATTLVKLGAPSSTQPGNSPDEAKVGSLPPNSAFDNVASAGLTREGAAGFSPLNQTPSAEPGFSPGVHPQPHPSAGLSFTKLDPPRVEPLRLELEDFLQAVAARTPPRVTAEAARAALALALEINAAIQAHAQATGLAKPPSS